MQFGWTEEQRCIGHAVEDFARKLNANLLGLDSGECFPRRTWLRRAEPEVKGLPLPEDLGRQGADRITTTLVLESPSL